MRVRKQLQYLNEECLYLRGHILNVREELRRVINQHNEDAHRTYRGFRQDTRDDIKELHAKVDEQFAAIWSILDTLTEEEDE